MTRAPSPHGRSDNAPSPDDHHPDLARAAAALANAKSVVVFTGAGVSAESGIPTFRGGMDALWKDFDPARLATPEAFAEDPETVSRWYDWRRIKCAEAEPNPGHRAIAEIERRLLARDGTFTLITQNVDRLHHRAGSRSVVELHGNITTWRCTITGRAVPMPDGPSPSFPIPSPHAPNALARPDVVWFGEMLPPAALRAAEAAVRRCDVLLSVGTSALVYPAAGFVELARAGGATIIEINRERSALSHIAHFALRGPSGEILPQLLANPAHATPQ